MTGRHRKPTPKKISFLGSTAGAFGALLIAGGIFAATQVIDGANPHEQTPKVAPHQQIEQIDIRSASGALDFVINGTSSATGTVAPSGVIPSAQVTATAPNVPGPATLPTVVIPPLAPNVAASADVRVPPIDVEAGVDIDVSAKVPLLGPAVNTVGDVARSVVEPITDPVLDTVENLLK